MTKVGLLVALPSEIPFVFRDTSIIHRYCGRLVKVVVTGMGQKKAGEKILSLCANPEGFAPDFLINLGFCGATNDELRIGDLIFADRLSYKKRKIQLKNSYTERLKEIFEGTRFYTGKLQTFDKGVFSRGRVDKDTLAVDMESFALGEISMKYQTPLIVVKIVSDIVPEKLRPNGFYGQVKSLFTQKRFVQERINEFVRYYFRENRP
jgi:nucleoside phosphorylase